MDQDTNFVIVSFAVLGPLALACLVMIGVAAVRFLRSLEAAGMPEMSDLRDDPGRKWGRVGDAARMSI